MKIELDGKTALITGSTGGIGYGIAQGLRAAGADVIVNGRKQDTVDAAIMKLRSIEGGGKVSGVAADLATEQGCRTVFEQIPDVDILVNNLGIFDTGDFFDTDDEAWTRYFEVNVLSGVRMARAYLKGMMDRGWGRMIFISSESGLNIPPDMLAYGFSKTANLSISRGLAKVAAGTGVTVNAVLPGPTLSDSFSAMFKKEHDKTGESIESLARKFVDENRPGSLIARAASVTEVANLVVYTASKEASATTGAALRVEGGIVDSIC